MTPPIIDGALRPSRPRASDLQRKQPQLQLQHQQLVQAVAVGPDATRRGSTRGPRPHASQPSRRTLLADVQQQQQQQQQKEEKKGKKKQKVTGAAGITAAAQAEKTTKPRGAGRAIDRRDGFFRTFNICALFGVAFYYAFQNGPNDNDGKMVFNRSLFYDTMVSEPVYMGIPALYLVAVWTLSRFMRDKPPATEFLRNRVQPIYNLTQIVLCAYMSWGLFPTDLRNPFGLNNKRDADIEWFVFVHFLSKYLDYVDTFVMVFKKSYRQISFLQVFHHATIAMVWPFLLSRGWGSGTASYGAFINSVTHVIMYTHYFVSSFGINNPFKKWITTFQLSQFASCIGPIPGAEKSKNE
ncbi:Elongation of very long chain fatty acids protein 5 [Hondaea fermentalgiana]|uniref:Elongation of fatty acids protein n=1 Tax=Hondaea fermentalgiana TaxID=2315210 RepID=A0A2R5GYZ5_9STRA|nr:Elongation of very long chain fatty acids protein 5 [Hondaea fermentalgiana]|eukprot:GBG33234.1 Elongation of very long chain fatty acids protein 5 [Hondaea fermentalgiana]